VHSWAVSFSLDASAACALFLVSMDLAEGCVQVVTWYKATTPQRQADGTSKPLL